ncbi:ParB/RepB/Spo0J family partition protein [Paenibacillus psychroresistens]|uniref:ParB/RepB/Spo0J family partition protein n=1 Tax=Paenibacillus psychroresistens TaxID=1778678 RepID=A0A6B8RUK8_9BACL|nr:ParB/RepB/Spo0J family partition protein [Paenibacillus psychroresistens]QGQ99489.1 ParB/RepB/Spo0J family partition protein [Paenibacillus psychroresistens]
MDIVTIPTHMIDEDTDQPRYQFDEESLQELMKSIEELGLLSPIKVRTTKDGRYKIIYGNRRYKACKTLGKPTIPCIVSNVTDELEIYLEQIAENLTREGFSPIEEAEAFNKLLTDPKFSSSTKYLSSKLGKPEAYIKNKCDLLKFSNAVKKLVVSGTEIKKDKLTEEQLMPIKELPIEHRNPLALLIAKDELSVSDVKRIAKLFKDKDISDSTKNKLLYKTGRELIETWSVFEQNRAERAKAVEPKAPASIKIEKSEKPAKNEEIQTISERVSPLENALQKLSSVLPVYNPFSLEILHAITVMGPNDKDSFILEINQLVDHLEKHLAEWKNVRELAASNESFLLKENL